MQDRYAADVGDFSKFALIRILARELSAKIGLIWYSYPDEAHNNDGKHIGYFSKRQWHACDPVLVERLRAVAYSRRSVEILEEAEVLPAGTKFFSELVHPSVHAGWNRTAWFSRAQAAVEGSDLVFVDPDNGIAGPSHSTTRSIGGKHITHCEIVKLANAHACVGIYHHFDRSAKHVVQMRNNIALLRELNPRSTVTAVRYRRISPRAYFLISRPEVSQQVSHALAVLSQKPWDYHFECLD